MRNSIYVVFLAVLLTGCAGSISNLGEVLDSSPLVVAKGTDRPKDLSFCLSNAMDSKWPGVIGFGLGVVPVVAQSSVRHLEDGAVVTGGLHGRVYAFDITEHEVTFHYSPSVYSLPAKKLTPEIQAIIQTCRST